MYINISSICTRSFRRKTVLSSCLQQPERRKIYAYVKYLPYIFSIFLMNASVESTLYSSTARTIVYNLNTNRLTTMVPTGPNSSHVVRFKNFVEFMGCGGWGEDTTHHRDSFSKEVRSLMITSLLVG